MVYTFCKKMKIRSILSAIYLVALSVPLSASESLKVSTLILTVPDAAEIPWKSGAITKNEWSSILRACAQIKGVPLFGAPAVTTASGTKAAAELKPVRTKTEGFWSRHEESPVFPVTEIEYTPTSKRGGTELSGTFVLNRDLVRNGREGEELLGGRVKVFVPDGKVLAFRLGGHIFGVTVTREE